MVDFHLSAGRNELRYVHEKYSDPCHGYVAFLCLANLPNDGSCTTSNDVVICISDNIDSSAQEGGLERPSQLKVGKYTAPSLTAMLTSQSEVCVTVLYFSCSCSTNIHTPKTAMLTSQNEVCVTLLYFSCSCSTNIHKPKSIHVHSKLLAIFITLR